MLISMAYPTVYIQEPGILHQSGEWLSKFGSKLFLIAGKTAWSKTGCQLEESLKTTKIEYELCLFSGKCTYEEVQRIQSMVNPQIDLIVAIGGGQCMDTAKLVAHRLALPIATVATLASNCASTTPLSIMYTDEHQFVGREYYDNCPLLTLVDPHIIAEAPYRYLVAGIGDTLAKWYEANPINEGKFKNAKTRLGLNIAELSRDLLFEFSEQAISENKECYVGEAIRQIIDTNILLAGLVGGIGNYTCRGSGAHSFHNGMTCMKDIHHAYHGEIVAFGIICQLILEQKPQEEIDKLMVFYQTIDLPISLFDLGISEVREDELILSAQRTCHPSQNIHHLPFTVTDEMAYKAIKHTHELGEKFKRRWVQN